MAMSALEIVHALVETANAVHTASKGMRICKSTSRKISNVSLEIAASIDNTAAAARCRGETMDLPISVTAALGATKDVFVQCANFMMDAASKGVITRHITKLATADMACGYLVTLEGLRELLKIRDNECIFMIEPYFGLGVDIAHSQNELIMSITTLDASYNGLKTMLNVMVRATDGLAWPLKAVPQTFLYILQLTEACQGVRPKAMALFSSVKTLWMVVDQVSSDEVTNNPQLRDQLMMFFQSLQRIAIRIHAVMGTDKVKCAMANHAVGACLELEAKRLDEARKVISLCINVYSHNQARKTGALVEAIYAHLAGSPTDASRAKDKAHIALLPPKPISVHGRDELITDIVGLLTSSGTAHIAIIGAGGIGKTTVALEALHHPRVADLSGTHRIFQSCEALVDADSLVGKLAEQCGVPPSTEGLQAAVVTQLAKQPRTIIVVDNLETIWLVGGSPAAAVDELLGTLAQIPSVRLVITCRGILLPQNVLWTNAGRATLEPFSLEAGLETFQDRAGRRLSQKEEGVARELLYAVDLMPLAVTLLGQLAQRGTPVSELLENWNIEHSALLQTHETGRSNNVEASIELSIKFVRAAYKSQEPLHLLSLCARLPDGLRPDVFEKLRPLFENIRLARDTLTAYSLINLGPDRVLKMLSPIRHLVLHRYSPPQTHISSLCSIYFDIADRLPIEVDETYKDKAAAAAPEMGNLSSLLLSLVAEPSHQVVSAIIRVTKFRLWLQPTTTLALALLSHIEQPQWKADCLKVVGHAQYGLNEFRSAINSFSTAAQLFLQVGDMSSMAFCQQHAGNTHIFLSEYSDAELLLERARALHVELGNMAEEANCRRCLGGMMRRKGNYAAAVDHLKAAQQTLRSVGELYAAAQASETLGITYREQNDLDSAAIELESSRLAFVTLGQQFHVAQSTRALGSVWLRKGDLTRAEELLREAENISTILADQQALAACAWEFGRLRRDQGRREEAILYFERAQRNCEAMGLEKEAAGCREEARLLRSLNG